MYPTLFRRSLNERTIERPRHGTFTQVAWHPASDAHFAALASDNVLRLYHVDDLTCPVSIIKHIDWKRSKNRKQDRIEESQGPTSRLAAWLRGAVLFNSLISRYLEAALTVTSVKIRRLLVLCAESTVTKLVAQKLKQHEWA